MVVAYEFRMHEYMHVYMCAHAYVHVLRVLYICVSRCVMCECHVPACAHEYALYVHECACIHIQD